MDRREAAQERALNQSFRFSGIEKRMSVSSVKKKQGIDIRPVLKKLAISAVFTLCLYLIKQIGLI